MKFTINNVSEEDLNITLVSEPTHLVSITLPDVIEAGKSVEGLLRLKDGSLEESFEKSFTFELSDEQNSRFTVPIKRTIRKPPTISEKISN